MMKKQIKGIRMLTDFEDCLLVSEYNYDYPVLIYNITRKDIDCNIHKDLELKQSHI